ncbi:Fpg/Nei family DNA glycosylase [Rubrobacter indicoceani]|uniref:Fpg/Nei family DNA glycosylase n=1 Tax=Rubrobacter indicoceani TaxID=2051957 RepID=UPI000E5A2778|nr:DNA-formamidopyrimidine glycosylase family protein [Rubrobacter indicoceani]
MPEGHSIHRYAGQHRSLFAGQRLRVDSPQGRFSEGASRLDGRVLEEVHPFGKHLWYRFSGGGEAGFLHVHLGLYGKFTTGENPPPEPKGAVRVRFVSEGRWLELRGPTACEIQTENERDAVLARLGPDPLVPASDGEPAKERIRRSRSATGKLLMDQSVVSGIGNIYRAEILFRAGISPNRPGNTLSDGEWRELWADTRTLMRAGVKTGRIVTTRPGHRPKKSGRVPRTDAFYVYKRDGQPCRICKTGVLRAEMAARNVFWCPKCQPE